MNLDLWRKKNIDEARRRIAKFNDKVALWTKHGSQAPLNLLLGGNKWLQLPEKAMQLDLGFQTIKKPRKELYFLHWNGINKPWKEPGLNKHLYQI